MNPQPTPSRAPEAAKSPHTLATRGQIALFGFPKAQAEVELLPRSLPWRASRALGFLGGSLLLSPAVGMVPPHVPWVVGVLGLGGLMGLRKWRERFTILFFRGLCPKCGGALSIPSGTPLKPVMSLPCEGCNHDSRMTVDLPKVGDDRGEIR